MPCHRQMSPNKWRVVLMKKMMRTTQNVKIAKVCDAKKLEDTACACPTPEKTTATGEPKSSEKTTAAKPVGKAKSKSQRPTATRSAYMQFMKN